MSNNSFHLEQKLKYCEELTLNSDGYPFVSAEGEVVYEEVL